MSDEIRWRAIVLETWTTGQHRSMVGPGPVDVHLTHAEELAALLEPPSRAADLGSGAGIPALALAGIWPRSVWTLIDSSQRRVDLLTQAIEALGWVGRVAVVHARAEDVGRDPLHRGSYDLVTARSFGLPAVTAECSAPLLRLGGVALVTDPPSGAADRWPADALAELGLVALQGASGAGARATRLRAEMPCPDRYPRRPGIPAKRPLWRT